MSQQNDLFNRFTEPLLVRPADPPSSHAAAADLIANNCKKLRGMQLLVERLIRERPGLTGRELDALHGDTQGQCHKRLKELERKGVIERGRPRTCTVSKRSGIDTWWPV